MDKKSKVVRAKRTIDDFTDKELADMVRGSGYIDDRTVFGGGPHDSRFLLVLAVPYGNADSVFTLPEALGAFQDLVSGNGSEGTNYQVYDHEDGSVSLESQETAKAGEDTDV